MLHTVHLAKFFLQTSTMRAVIASPGTVGHHGFEHRTDCVVCDGPRCVNRLRVDVAHYSFLRMAGVPRRTADEQNRHHRKDGGNPGKHQLISIGSLRLGVS